MIINRCYDYKPLERVTREDGVRHYLCPETNTMVPSITTILSATSDKKESLQEWRDWVGAEKADQIKNEACALGSLMHLHIENFVSGIERPRGNNLIRVMAAKMSDQIIKNGLCHVDEVWGQEVALYYPGLFAGTTDLVGIYKGKTAIMDHKTAKKMRSRKDIDDYLDQAAAYRTCHNHLFGTNIEIGVIFMVDREYNFKEFIIDEKEMVSRELKFIERVEKYLAAV